MTNNAVAHFEIYAANPDGLAEFYTKLFNWQIEPVPGMDYRVVRSVQTDAHGVPTEMGGINGGLLTRPAGFDASAWVNYVNVESVEAAVKKAQGLGAKLTKAKTAVPNMGWFAMLMDPQGNHFAVWQSDRNAR